MNKKKKKKIIRYSIIGSIVVLLLTSVIVSVANKEEPALQFKQTGNTDVMEFNPFIENEQRLDNSFLEYGKVLNKYKKAGYLEYTGNDLVLRAIDYKEGSVTGGEVKPFNEDYVINLNDKEFKITADPWSIQTESTRTTLVYELDVPETALYNLKIEYALKSGKNTDMLIGFTINGKQPFIESSYLEAKRMYEFYEVDRLDEGHNQIRSKQREVFGWQTSVMTHPDGLYRNPYKILLTEGKNTIEMSFSREAGIIRTISFVAPEANGTYDDYLQSNNFSNDQIYNGKPNQIEMEVPVVKNDVTIRSEWNDDYFSYPASYDYLHYNVFGGDKWDEGGSSAKWEFEVPETGWYQLSFRYNTTLTYVASYREIKIDGDILFDDMEEYCFPYSDGWAFKPLINDKQKPYLFYLEKDKKHTIEITAKVGPLRHELQRIDECTDSINELIRDVTKLVAASRKSDGTYAVAKNMDWDLEQYIPDIVENLKQYSKSFNHIFKRMKETNGGHAPYYASALQVASEFFKNLSEDTEDVPGALNEINNIMSGVSNSTVSMKNQPLSLDYMVIAKEGYTKDVRSGTWQNIYVGTKKFYWSFKKDYASIGALPNPDGPEDMETISVYVARGREHVEIMRTLISEEFTRETGIKVDLNMVAGGVEGQIMLRYVAGNAPDVAISVGSGTPFEYAIRGALLPLDELPGFDELKESSYLEHAFTPYLFKGHYYAFPETQDWSALFYRTDILDELQIDVPQTWEDVYKMLPVLQEEGLDFSYGFGVGNYIPFLYQLGGDLYDKDGIGHRNCI